MKKGILIVKNVTREGPGILLDIIKDHHLSYTIVDLSLGQNDISLENYGAVVVLGGPDSANDETKKMKYELAMARDILKADIPYLGICLGFQVLVKAVGGKVVQCHTKEIGFRDKSGRSFTIELTPGGKDDALLNGLVDPVNVFHLHGETVIPEENMVLLATGTNCRNQIMKYGSHAYGIQSHLELTPEMFGMWINEDPDLLALDKDKLISDYSALSSKIRLSGRRIFSNFLSLAGFI